MESHCIDIVAYESPLPHPELPPTTSCVFFNPLQGERGNVALIMACQYGDIEGAMVLLDHGADINYQDEVYKTNIFYGKYSC